MEYDFDKNEELSQVNEPALAYEGSCSSVEERVAYMKKNLHPATVEFLEQHDFMVDKPFPLTMRLMSVGLMKQTTRILLYRTTSSCMIRRYGCTHNHHS